MALLRTGWSAVGDGQELQWWFFPEHGVLVGLRSPSTVRTLVVACGSLPWDDSMIGGSLGRPAWHN